MLWIIFKFKKGGEKEEEEKICNWEKKWKKKLNNCLKKMRNLEEKK